MLTFGYVAITAMMAQFLEIRAWHRDAILFYRMGDFYGMFFGDAVAAAAAVVTPPGTPYGTWSR